MKTKTTHTDKKDMKRTLYTNWSDNSKHSLWLIRRKKLQIVVSLGELFLFVAYWTMIPIFSPRSRFFFGQIQIFHFNWVAGLLYMIYKSITVGWLNHQSEDFVVYHLQTCHSWPTAFSFCSLSCFFALKPVKFFDMRNQKYNLIIKNSSH